MSPQVTFKSTENKVPEAGALVDSAGAPVGPAPRLAQAVLAPFSPSHGSAPAELPQLPVGLQDLGPAAALRVIGPDREKWMQGMHTGDLAAAPYGSGVETAFLGAKGRLVAPAIAWRFPEELLITTDPSRLDALQKHLDALLIMEDCELSRAEGLRRLRYLPSEAPPRDVPAEITGVPGALGFELLLPEAGAQALLERIPERPRPDLIEARRVALGVPAWGTELDEDVTAIEAGLDRMLSFSKGCYVGQEVVAMATYRGRVSWNLVRLQVAGAAPAPGMQLGAKAASGRRGQVTSSTQVGAVGLFLGYVQKDQITPGSQVALADGRTATVLGLPFGSKPGAGVCA